MHYYLDVIKKYAVFDGRARRKEYWMFYLVNTIIDILFYIIAFLLGLGKLEAIFYGLYFIIAVYGLFILLPTLGVTVRRLHDTGRTGWWILFYFVPFIGGLWLLILMVTDSDSGENQYGPNPKYAVIEESM